MGGGHDFAELVGERVADVPVGGDAQAGREGDLGDAELVLVRECDGGGVAGVFRVGGDGDGGAALVGVGLGVGWEGGGG